MKTVAPEANQLRERPSADSHPKDPCDTGELTDLSDRIVVVRHGEVTARFFKHPVREIADGVAGGSGRVFEVCA